MPKDLATMTRALLADLGVDPARLDGGSLIAASPITGETIACVHETGPDSLDRAVADAHRAFLAWRQVPAPRRGEFVRILGEELRRAKDKLGLLVSIEVGKVLSEGLGEVQEMIDICDFAVGLSRQLHGLCLPSERRDHRITEQWHPIGPVGVIFRVQLSGRRGELERRDRARLWQQRHLETFRKGASHGARGQCAG